MFPVSGMMVFYFVVGEFLAGAFIGVVAAAIAFRSRFRAGLAVRAGGFAGFAFVIFAIIGGRAGAHSAFHNGQRLDTAPWGENLWLRNRMAENELAICVISSVVAGLAGMRFTSMKKGLNGRNN